MPKLTIQDLLFNEQPITINRKLAKCLGLKEAVVFQQIHYWLEINKQTNNNFKEDRYWTYNSIKQWHEKHFDFLSVRTLERTLAKLEKSGLLITKVFNKWEGDKTKWYTIDYEKLLEVCEKFLGEKEKLSQKRKAIGKLGAESRLENSQSEDAIQPNWQHDEPSNQIGNMVPPNWQNGTAKLAEPIPEITTEITTEISPSSNISSSKGISPNSLHPLVDLFNGSICELKRTTTKKFMAYVERYDEDFIKAVIAYCENKGAKAFSYFEKTINSYIEKNITTAESFEKDVEGFYEKKSKAKKEAPREKDLKKQKETVDDYDPYEDVEIKYEFNGEDAEHIKEMIRPNVTVLTFNTWFANMKMKINKNVLIMACENTFTKEVIENRYLDTVIDSLRQNDLDLIPKVIVF